MSDFKRARELRKILDKIEEKRVIDSSDVQQLRKALPELPKQKTLEEVIAIMNDAAYDTVGSRWRDDVHGPLETWLHEKVFQLEGLVNTSQALPEGMRLAKHEELGNVVVSPKVDEDGDYLIFFLDEQCVTGCDYMWVDSSALTFVDTQTAYLETIEDYEGAPEHTTIGGKWGANCPAWVKEVSGEWVAVGGGGSVTSTNLAGDRRKVLYWPKEKEEK